MSKQLINKGDSYTIMLSSLDTTTVVTNNNNTSVQFNINWPAIIPDIYQNNRFEVSFSFLSNPTGNYFTLPLLIQSNIFTNSTMVTPDSTKTGVLGFINAISLNNSLQYSNIQNNLSINMAYPRTFNNTINILNLDESNFVIPTYYYSVSCSGALGSNIITTATTNLPTFVVGSLFYSNTDPTINGVYTAANSRITSIISNNTFTINNNLITTMPSFATKISNNGFPSWTLLLKLNPIIDDPET